MVRCGRRGSSGQRDERKGRNDLGRSALRAPRPLIVQLHWRSSDGRGLEEGADHRGFARDFFLRRGAAGEVDQPGDAFKLGREGASIGRSADDGVGGAFVEQFIDHFDRKIGIGRHGVTHRVET
jgi:hypothetical protein